MNDGGNSAEISRRTLVKGSAWSLPVIATAITAPMAAATGGEPERQVAGNLSMGFIYTPGMCFTKWSIGSPQDYALSVAPTDTNDTVTNGSITFWIHPAPATGDVTWSALPGNDGTWTVPEDIGTGEIEGHSVRGYRMYYTAGVTAGTPQTVLMGKPSFATNTVLVCGDGTRTGRWVQRDVTVNGVNVTSIKGQSFLPRTPPAAMNRMATVEEELIEDISYA